MQLCGLSNAGIAGDEETGHAGMARFAHERIELIVEISADIVLDEQVLLDHTNPLVRVGSRQRSKVGIEV